MSDGFVGCAEATPPHSSSAVKRTRNVRRGATIEGYKRTPVAELAVYNAALMAFSNARRPIEPSRRAAIVPSERTVNSQGSVGRLNCCSGLRRPLLGSLFA